MTDEGTWIAVILGIIGGLFLYWVASKNRTSRRRSRRDLNDLDDWDSMDQLEGDKV